jgi:hypothetical protein
MNTFLAKVAEKQISEKSQKGFVNGDCKGIGEYIQCLGKCKNTFFY